MVILRESVHVSKQRSSIESDASEMIIGMKIEARLWGRRENNFLKDHDGAVVILRRRPTQSALRRERENAHPLGAHCIDVAVWADVRTKQNECSGSLVEPLFYYSIRRYGHDKRRVAGINSAV